MVAELGTVKTLTLKRAKFAALVAEGATLHSAYKLVFSPNAARRTAEVEGCRLAAIPEIAAEIARIRSLAFGQRILSMQERRGILGDIARAGSVARALREAKPGDAINAIREDAILAGERRTDGTQVSLSVDVSATLVIGALRGGVGLTEAREVTEVAVESVQGKSASEVTAQPDHTPALTHVSQPIPSAATCGPLGELEADAGAGDEARPAFVDRE